MMSKELRVVKEISEIMKRNKGENGREQRKSVVRNLREIKEND